MTLTIRVYQPELTNSQIARVNATGWDSVPEASNYLNLTSFPKEDTVADKIAAAYALYRHTRTIHDVSGPDEVFAMTNDGGYDPRITCHRRAKSGSVGDVLIAGWGSDLTGWVCMSFGWHELTQDQIKAFECEVATTMVLAS